RAAGVPDAELRSSTPMLKTLAVVLIAKRVGGSSAKWKSSVSPPDSVTGGARTESRSMNVLNGGGPVRITSCVVVTWAGAASSLTVTTAARAPGAAAASATHAAASARNSLRHSIAHLLGFAPRHTVVRPGGKVGQPRPKKV